MFHAKYMFNIRRNCTELLDQQFLPEISKCSSYLSIEKMKSTNPNADMYATTEKQSLSHFLPDTLVEHPGLTYCHSSKTLLLDTTAQYFLQDTLTLLLETLVGHSELTRFPNTFGRTLLLDTLVGLG